MVVDISSSVITGVDARAVVDIRADERRFATLTRAEFGIYNASPESFNVADVLF